MSQPQPLVVLDKEMCEMTNLSFYDSSEPTLLSLSPLPDSELYVLKHLCFHVIIHQSRYRQIRLKDLIWKQLIFHHNILFVLYYVEESSNKLNKFKLAIPSYFIRDLQKKTENFQNYRENTAMSGCPYALKLVILCNLTISYPSFCT